MLIYSTREMTRDDLRDCGQRLAGALEALGLASGARVGLLLRNDFAYLIAHDAARYQRLDMVPINWHLTGPELEYLLNDCDASLVIAHADLLTPSIRAAIGTRQVITVATPPELSTAYPKSDATGSPDDLSWSDFLANADSSQLDPAPMQPPLFYTSGTSGHPKAVKRESIPIDVMAAIGKRTMHAWGFGDAEIRAVMTGPLYHSAPNGYANLVLRSGGTLVLQPRFDGSHLLELIEQHRITHLHMVPTMFVRLLKLPEQKRNAYDLSSLQCVAHGAAPCPPEVKRAMIEWWGPVIREYYAMTETGIITTSSSEEWSNKPGSVGRAAASVSIEIRDDEGKPCPANTPGVICVRHEGTNYVGYYNAAEKTKELHQDDFLVTGDVGYLDQDGFLFISDRKTDLIIAGGVNIYPAEIENVLVTMPNVTDCAVFGIPDLDLGERVVAFVETNVTHTEDEIHAFLAKRIARYKIPRTIEFTSQLPREDSGKIKKRLLRERYLASIN